MQNTWRLQRTGYDMTVWTPLVLCFRSWAEILEDCERMKCVGALIWSAEEYNYLISHISEISKEKKISEDYAIEALEVFKGVWEHWVLQDVTKKILIVFLVWSWTPDIKDDKLLRVGRPLYIIWVILDHSYCIFHSRFKLLTAIQNYVYLFFYFIYFSFYFDYWQLVRSVCSCVFDSYSKFLFSCFCVFVFLTIDS